MRIPAFHILALALCLSLAPAFAADRVEVKDKLRVIDRETGQATVFPPRSGYTYEFVKLVNGQAQVKVFDPSGTEVEGEFLLPPDQLKGDLQDSITAGLKAAAKGAEGDKAGCCDVQEPEKEADPDKVTRAPAIAPGAKIVYDTRPVPPRTPAPAAPRTPDRRVVASNEPAICQKFRQFERAGVPAEPLRQALAFYHKRQQSGRYVAIADYSQNSKRKRFYLLDLQTGTFKAEKVSHGGGNARWGNPGDPNHDGMLNKCGNSNGLTRPGFYQTDRYYQSFSGRFRWPLLSRRPPRNGVRLRGLTPGVNTDAFSDGVVMHEAKYNKDGNAVMGRSHGCPAFVPGKGAPLLSKMVSDSSLLYSYAPVCASQMSRVLSQVPNWQSFCR